MSGGHPIFLSWGRGASFFPIASELIHTFPLQSFRLHVSTGGSQMSTWLQSIDVPFRQGPGKAAIALGEDEEEVGVQMSKNNAKGYKCW